MLRNLLAMVALIAFVTTVAGQPAPKKPDPTALVTKVYDLKPILGEKGKPNGLADTDAVIKVILDSFPALRELKPGTNGPQIVERDGGKLEVRAPAEVHGELKDLIEAMKNLTDVAIDMKAEVFELSPATFEKFTQALPKVGRGKAGSPVLFVTGEEIEELEIEDATSKALADVNKILRTARSVQSSTARFNNGAETTFSARQSLLTFQNNLVNDLPAGPPQFVKEGFKLVGVPVISADRRYVRLKLTEQSTAVTRMKKVQVGEVVANQNLVMQSPVLEDLGASGSAEVSDGGTAIFRLAYAPKDKVWVVVLKPTIFIQAEEDELKKQEKK